MSISVAIKHDAGFSRLARDLRFEAKRAEVGEVVDEVKGVPAYKTHGSEHERRLKCDAKYREAYTIALLETADKAQACAELGELEIMDEAPNVKTILTTIRDPKTGEPISVRRALEDTPLNRARYASAEPISDLQWLAGMMYAADSAGDVPYNGNAAIIAANGNSRIKGEGRSHDLRADSVSADETKENLSYNNSDEMTKAAYRFAKVQRVLSASERLNASVWLVAQIKPSNGRAFVALLDKLVNLYAAHDDYFSFDKYRHNFASLGRGRVEDANDNAAPPG